METNNFNSSSDLDEKIKLYEEMREKKASEMSEMQAKIEAIKKEIEGVKKTKDTLATQSTGLNHLITAKRKQIERVTQGFEGTVRVSGMELNLSCDISGSFCPYVVLQVNKTKATSEQLIDQNKSNKQVLFPDSLEISEVAMTVLEIQIYNGSKSAKAGKMGKFLCSGCCVLTTLEAKMDNELEIKLYKIGGRVKTGLARGELKMSVRWL